MTLAAAVPVYNGARTLERVLAAVRRELAAAGGAELLVIDDGCVDASPKIAQAANARVIALGANLGRGAARSRIMAETDAEFVLMCDATVELPEGFVERALRYLQEAQVAAVFGPMETAPPKGVADRWRKRHLFKAGSGSQEFSSGALLATWACVLRSSAVRAAGGFDPALRANEDADLGARLLAAGHKVIFAPELSATSISSDTVATVIERYVRWNTQGRIQWRGYLRQIAYAIKVMAREDFAAGDWPAAFVSLLTPHAQWWASRKMPVAEPKTAGRDKT